MRQKKQDDQGLSKVGMLRSFEGDCTACGQRIRFTVDALGYCKCGRCGSQVNFRLGVPKDSLAYASHKKIQKTVQLWGWDHRSSGEHVSAAGTAHTT